MPAKKTSAKAKSKAKKAAPKAKVKKAAVKAKEPKLVKSQKNEVWKKMKSGSSSPKMNYMLSSNGRIKSVDKKSKDEQLIKGTYTKGGYHQFNIKYSPTERKTFYVHREVAKLFLGKRKKGQDFVCHKNGDKKNNKIKNLFWATRTEWSALHKKLGTYQGLDRTKNEKYYKLTEGKVKQIKKSLRAGKKTKTAIAQRFDVSITQINRIASGENWGHVTI